MDEAFKAFKYVPYSSLTHTARLKASRGEEEFVVNAHGGLTAKGLDRCEEKAISLSDWLGASKTAEDRIRAHHGETRALAFAAHHRIVTDLARLHNWAIALEYDIQQRELVVLSPSHDLSTLDQQALTLIVTRHIIQTAQIQSSGSSHSGLKRSAADAPPSTPRKQPRLCFRCGFPGHFPDNCRAESTSAGRPTAPLATGTKSKNTLVGPNNKFYCFNWAKDSSCSFGNSCNNIHACSLCGDASHGARACKTRI